MREVAGVPGVYEHHGIDCGNGTIIHYQKLETAVVSQTPLATFARGSRVYVKSQSVAFLPEIVVQRAEGRLGEQRYDLLTNNCEHFATWCKTGRHESAQLTRFGLNLDHWNLPQLQTLIEGTSQNRSPEEAIALFHKALGDIAAAHTTLQHQYRQAQEAQTTWQRVAQEAVRRGRDDLARAALHRKVAAQKQMDRLTQQLTELVDVQLTLERNRRLSEQRLV